MKPTKIFRYNEETQQVEERDGQLPKVDYYLGNNAWSTGLRSDSLGVHSSQVGEFRQDLADNGISGVDIRDNGTVVFESRRARKRYMEHRGAYDRDAGYSDAVPRNF